MSHVDPDQLALQALGEDAMDAESQRHLDDCAECRAELALLARAAVVGRSTFGQGDLLTPPERVWSRIADELGIDTAAPAVAAPAAAAEPAAPALNAVPAAVADSPAEPAEASPAPIPLRPRRWVRPFAVAAAAAVVIAGGAGVTWSLLRPQTEVLATASLDSFPDWGGSGGSAELEAAPDGSRMVRVELDAPESDGYREVWLITSDATELVSLGILDGAEGTFPVPAGIDTDRYDLVDISAEPLDGDPAHSGDSIVRGQLQS